MLHFPSRDRESLSNKPAKKPENLAKLTGDSAILNPLTQPAPPHVKSSLAKLMQKKTAVTPTRLSPPAKEKSRFLPRLLLCESDRGILR